MSQIYNIYCDESCHLENDHKKTMVLGAIWCQTEKIRSISQRIREIKIKNGLGSKFEMKWTKISPAKINFYLEMIDYFFDDDDLNFRCLIIPDKTKLDHKRHNQEHDDWYYKMYFDMLKVILSPEEKYRIYLDIKDTRSAGKVKKLHEVLCNNLLDFDRQIIERVQIVRSHEIEILQLTDLLIGAVSNFYNLGESASEAKKKIISRIKERSKYSLEKSTLYRENKFNLFIWQASL